MAEMIAHYVVGTWWPWHLWEVTYW
jgi:hypothetical protein